MPRNPVLKATARALSNIALVKYWGKRDLPLNLPARGSVSMTLAGLSTTTSVVFDPAIEADELTLNQQDVRGQPLERVSTFLDLVRTMADIKIRCRVTSVNSFPTAAGLASSASGFAALALAAASATELDLDPRALSILARQGSGSAARSVFGGFVRMHEGKLADGTDSFAEPIELADHWDLSCVVAITVRGPKKVGSTDGMAHTEGTSPFYRAWLDSVNPDIEAAEHAIRSRDFERLAAVAEASCLSMHASAMAARPGVLYWRGPTMDLIHEVREMRQTGTPAFFTIDAGPHVKVFCETRDASEVERRLVDVPGVVDTIIAAAGEGAKLIDDENTENP